MDNLRTLTGSVLVEVGERRQKRRFNFLLALFFAILAMTAIIAAPIVQSFVSKKVAAVAEWTDGLTPQVFGTETWAGSGTETDAFKIATATDLAQLACNVNAGTTYEGMYFTLTSELNLAGREWTPIGTMAHPFMGTFDGAQKAIYFMTMTGDRYDYYGLFGVVKESLITKVDMRNSYVNVSSRSGEGAVGGIVGYAENTNISYSTNGSNDIEKIGFPTNELTDVSMSTLSSIDTWFSQAQKRGVMTKGGVTDSVGNGETKKHSNSNDVSNTSDNVGGIVGEIKGRGSKSASLTYCWNTGNITGNKNVGGIAGYALADTYSTGSRNTSGNTYVSQCASVADIKATNGVAAGGIVGYAFANAGNAWLDDRDAHIHIYESYARGTMTATSKGSILGYGYREDHKSTACIYIGLNEESQNRPCAYRSTETGPYLFGNHNGLVCNSIENDKDFCTSKDTFKPGQVNIYSSNWTDGTSKSSDEGEIRTTTTLYITPKGTTAWTEKSAAPYNYYEEKTTLAKYTVTLDKNYTNGGTSSLTVIQDQKVGKIDIPTRGGYIFLGYYTGSSDGTQYIDSNGNGLVPITSDITLYAHWEAQKVKINFYVNDGVVSTYYSKFAKKYSEVVEGDKSWPTTEQIANHVPQYYDWDGKFYNDKSTETINDVTVTKGQGAEIGKDTIITDTRTEINLYAGLTRKVATIKFDPNGGSITGGDDKEITYGKTIDNFPVVKRTGYAFNGWWDALSGGSQIDRETPINSSMTLYAHWTANTYTVSFDQQGGTDGPSEVTATYDRPLPDLSSSMKPQKEYYVFQGYFTEINGKGTQYYANNLISTENTWQTAGNGTLYAHYGPATVTINYELNGGYLPSGEPSSLSAAYGNAVRLPTPIRTGYTFSHWSKVNNTQDGNKISLTTSVNSSTFSLYSQGNGSYETIIYAQWNVKSLKLTLSASDADSNSKNWANINGWNKNGRIADKTVTYGTLIGTMPTPTKTGSTFQGWFIENSAKQYTKDNVVDFDVDITLYARWTSNEYTLRIDPMGGTYSGDKTLITGIYGRTIDLGTVTRTGYDHTGWEISGSGSVTKTQFTFGAGSATITAKFTPKRYTMTFVLNDSSESWGVIPSGVTASGGNYVKTVTYDAKIGDMPSATKTGYRFLGWYESASSEKVWQTSTKYDEDNSKTLYAKFSATPFVLTVDRDNGQGAYTVPGTTGEKLALPSGLTKEGYSFVNWEKTTGAAGTLSGFTFTFGDSDATVVARWNANGYTVAYNANGGVGSMGASSYTYGSHGTLTLNAFTRTGWTFNGWNTKADGKGSGFVDGADVYNLTSKNGETLTLYAQWKAITYTVTFSAGAGTIVTTAGFTGRVNESISIVTYNYGQTLGVLPNATQTGYRFDGWYYQNTYNTLVKTSDKVTESRTLYAKFTANTYTLTLSASNATINAANGWNISADKHSATKTMTYDAPFGVLPTASLDGYNFRGWYDGTGENSTSYAESSVYKFSGAKTLYARFEVESVMVFFDAMGGKAQTSQRIIPYNSQIGALPTATFAGYTLAGWFYASDKQASASDIITETVTLTAKWTANKYRLTFNANGGIFNAGDTYTKDVTYNEPIGDFPNVTKSGARLVGWFESKEGTGAQYVPSTIVRFTKDVTIYAHYENETYLVIFNANGGSSKVASKEYEYGEQYDDLPTASKVGFKFLGWAKDEDSSLYIEKTWTVTNTHTLYAQYQANTYYIVFDKNSADATGTEMSKMTVKYGQSVKLSKNTYQRSGFDFRGWTPNSNGTGDIYTDEQIVYNLTTVDAGEFRLYAKWVGNTYTVTIDILNTNVVSSNNYQNSGSYALKKTFSYGEKIGAFPTLTKRGYNLTGFRDEKGNNVTVDTQVLDDMRLYPQFSAIQVTYTFDANGGVFKDSGSGTYENGYVKIRGSYDSTIGLLPTVERIGYDFVYYVKDDGSNAPVFAGSTFNSEVDIRVIALWDIIDYVVTFDAGKGTIDKFGDYEGGSSTTNITAHFNEPYGTLPSATLRGFTFAGWYTEQNMKGTKIETNTPFEFTKNITLYAGWSTSKYIATISANGGYFGSPTTTTATLQGDFGKAYEIPIPTRTGYTFTAFKHMSNDDGVASDSTGKWMFTFGLGNAELSAQWTPNTYTLTFDYVQEGVTNVGGGDLERTRTVTYDKEYGSLPIPQTSGKTFAGWKRADGTIVSGSAIVKETSDFTLTAHWTQNGYSLVINPNGGVYSESSTTTIIEGKALNNTIPIATPTREGYTFASWTETFVGKDGSTSYRGLSGASYKFGEGNGTLTANWNAISYQIKFEGGVGSVGTMENQTIFYDTSVALTMNTFTKAGYDFKNWRCDELGTEFGNTETVKNLTSTANKVLTFVAQWSVKTYELTIDPNGGSYNGKNSAAKISEEYGKTTKIYASSFERRGYNFVGLEENDNLTGNVADGYTYTFNAYNDTITAIWEVRVINVTLVIPMGATWTDAAKTKYNVGADNNGHITATFGEMYKNIPVADDIVYAGHDFSGFMYDGNVRIDSTSIVNYEDDITLVANYGDNIYVFTIVLNDGKIDGSTATQNYNGQINDEVTFDAPTKTGYLLTEWKRTGDGELTEENGKFKFKFAADNCRIEAQWAPIKYTVTFVKNDTDAEGSMNDIQCEYDSGKRLPSVGFTKTGYTFTQWTLDAAGNGNGYGDGAYFQNLTTENGNTVKLYAQWKVTDYIIVLDANKGTLTQSSITRSYGEAYGDIPEAIREGYTLAGWYTLADGGKKINADDVVTGAITLYAHWTANTYTITFNAGSGRIAAGDDGYTGAVGGVEGEITVTFGGYYEKMPIAVHDTKVFAGWFVSERADSLQIEKTTIVTVANNQTLYAHWVEDQYTVSFDPNGGTVSEHSRTVSHGEPYGVLPVPTKTGYHFDGWFFEEKNIQIADSSIVNYKGDHTLCAHWTALKFTVSFDYDGGEYVETEGYEGDGTKKGVTYDQTFGVLPMAAKTGMRFLGWFDADDKLIDESKLVKILEDITVKAKYENILYTLTIELDGGKYGDLEQVQSFTGIYEQTIEILAPTKTGYNFASYENRLGIGSVEKVGDIYHFTFGADNSTLYAIWKAMDIRVTFHAQDGELFGSNTAISNDKKTGMRQYKFGDKFNVVSAMPNARLEGYRFLGWFTEPDGGFQMTDEMEITIPTNFDLYAQYEPILYILTIDPQGGVFNNSQHTYDFKDKKRGDEVTFNTPTREGYRFLRFIMTGEGTLTAQDEQLSSYKFVFGAGNATLTAVWENEKYIVTFDYNGADGGDTTETLEVTYDQMYDALPVPTKTGYDFVGWFTTADDEGMKIDNTTTVKIARNHTLYAHWELHKYKLQVILSGGSIDGAASTDVEFEAYFNEIVDFSIPTRYGYLFKEFEKVGDKGTLDIREGEGKVYFTFGDDNCKLVAIWENKEIIVNFDYDNATSGNEIASKTVKFDEAYGELPTPAKAGYNFVGWFDSRDDENRVQIIPSVLVKNAETHTLFAVFEEITTSLTIVLNGGDLVLEENPINKKFGETFTFGEPTKTGYDFTGYTSTVDGALKNNGDGTWTYTFGLSNAVVSAEWAAQSVDVTFKLSSDAIEDGVEIDWTDLTHSDDVMKVTYGEKYGTLPKVSRYGWEFNGWFTEENGQGERIIDTSIVTNPEDHTLYAYFEQYEFTLKIDLNGGTAEGQQLTIIGHAKDVINVIAPTKIGYTFAGFTIVSGDITQSGGETLAEKLTFTFKESDAIILANYTANTYTLTFNANGTAENPASIPTSTEWIVGEGSNFATKIVTFGDRINAMPTPIRDGYTFIGWTISGTEGDKDVYTPLTRVEFAQDLTLNATWSADKFALTIDLDGGKLLDQDSSVITFTASNGQSYDITSTPTKTGYKFERFEIEYAVEGQGRFEKTGNTWKFTFGSGNATITAIWTPIEIVITLDANGAQFDESSLNGWTLAADKNSATKTFNYKDLLGKIENSDGTTSIGALPQVSLEGSKFTGWFVDETQYSETSPIEWLVNTTLTASFAMNNYLLVINTNGGTYSDDEYNNKVGVFNISKVYGTIYNVANPSKTGYKFTGWTGSGVGTFDNTLGAFTFGAGTYTLVAEYEPIKYTIKFDANGGTGTMDAQEFTYDISDVLNENKFTYAGYTFKEWNTAADGTGEIFANMGMVLNETDVEGDEITLYAIWNSAWITMYFDANNGTADPVGMKVEHGKPFGALPRVERKGYNFGGWYESIVNDVPQGEPIEATTICKYTESRTFVAFWTIASYEITLPSGYPQDSMTLNVLDTYKGTLSEDGSKATILYNHDFAFEITILEAYSQSNIRVYATIKTTQVKKEILPINGAYMLTQIADDMVISVENLNKNTYKVVFDAREGLFGNSQYTTVTVEWGGKITRPTRPTRLHYDFIGWFASISSLAEFDFATYEVYADLTLYAKYEKANYKITFYVDDEVFWTDSVQYESVVTKPNDPIKEGYNFVGWRLVNGAMYSFSSQVTGELNLYAEFDKNTYTVRFYNGDRLLDTVEIKYGETVKVNFPVGITGYDLEGWYADAAFTTLFDFDQIITSDTNIYGKYVLQQFKVDFYVNGELQATQQVGYNHWAKIPTGIIVEVGHHIANWYTDVDLTQLFDFGKSITSDLVLFGKIEKDDIVITFVANEQKILRYVKYGDSLAPSEIPVIPARIGYDKVAPYWEDADLTNITSPLTINAVYTINKYTVTIIMPDGSHLYKEVEYGKTLTDLPKIKTKFGDKVVYDQDLSNITSNLVVHIEVQNYIFWPLVIAGGILALLLIVFFIIMIVKINEKRSSRDKIKELIDTNGR